MKKEEVEKKETPKVEQQKEPMYEVPFSVFQNISAKVVELPYRQAQPIVQLLQGVIRDSENKKRVKSDKN